jgi:two-component system, sensor histidine kinase and response regulator
MADKPLSRSAIVHSPTMPETTNDADAILQSAVDCIIIADYSGTIVEFNPAAEKAFGYTRDEALGRNLAETIVPPSFRDLYQQGVDRLHATGETHLTGIELRGVRSDGTEFPLEFWLSTISFRGLPVCIARMRDITARKRAERRLAAQYGATRALAVSNTLAEAAPRILEAICEGLGWSVAILWDVDRRDHVLVAGTVWQGSTATTEFVDASRQSMFALGVGLPGRVWESAKPVWVVDVQKDTNFPRHAFAQATGLRAAFAFPILIDAGVLGVMEFFSIVNHPPDEDLLEMMAAIGSQMGQFIERKRKEEEHLQSEERSRRMIDTSLDAVVTMDTQGLITGWNPQAEVTFGWTRDEAIGRRMSEIIIPLQHREAHERGLKHFLVTGTGPVLNTRIEITALRRTGDEFPVELAICPLKLEQGWAFSAFIRNISDRKESENQRKKAQEALQHSYEELELRVQERTKELHAAKESAEQASRAKSEFLANMSHEIRTPMNGIIGMTELTLDTELDSSQREYLNAVKFSAESLLTVINDILDFSKIEVGKLSLDPIEFNLRDCLGQAMKSLSIRAHEKQLELACSVPPDLVDFLVGDPVRLRQVILNLVGNAIKFTEQGEVVLRVQEEAADADGVTLHVTISDTGIGIPPEKQELIFEPFAQADTSTTRKYGGTGLGLSISMRLIEMMGGRIWLESESGKGCTFHFTARFGKAAATVSTGASADPAILENMRVLVVDDNATNRQILERTLGYWRMRPTAASGAEAGLVLLQKAKSAGVPFGLMIVDCHMPEMDGFMLVEQVKKAPDLSGLVTVMLTSGGQRGDGRRCKELGIAAYLIKPVQQSELLETLLRVLGSRPDAARPVQLVTRHSLREARMPLRILLAEDNVVNQRLAVRLLEKQGHMVFLASDGVKALEAMENHSFDLVFMDVQMPVMDGVQATAAIREKEKATGTHIPIVAMTAHAMAGDRRRFLESGMDGYVSKPVHSQELFDAIETALSPAATPELQGNDRSLVVNRVALNHASPDLS